MARSSGDVADADGSRGEGRGEYGRGRGKRALTGMWDIWVGWGILGGRIFGGREMSGYDPSRHHRRSIRLRDYDYSQCGLYFITVCIQRREWLLGRVREGVFYPSPAGSVVQRGIETLSLQYPGIAIECWVVMPNHIHFILEIKQRMHNPVSEKSIAIGEFIRQLKYETTKQINQLRNTPGVKVWQRNYYERIIWDDHAHRTIANYIHQNPKRWTTDNFR